MLLCDGEKCFKCRSHLLSNVDTNESVNKITKYNQCTLIEMYNVHALLAYLFISSRDG